MIQSGLDPLLTRIRPGLGQPQGITTTTSTALSAFQVVRPDPGAFSSYVGYTRINLVWQPGVDGLGFDGFQVVFGPSDAAIQAAAFVGAPVFIKELGPFSWLLVSTDLGFKVQSTGAGTDRLIWWLG